jgi:transcriptional regulator with AAA-type ATPase domain
MSHVLVGLLRRGLRVLLAPAKDPRETFADPWRQHRAALTRARAVRAGIGRARQRLEARIAETRERLAGLDEQARRAVAAGRDEEARLALECSGRAEAQLRALEEHMRAATEEERRLALVEQRLAAQVEAISDPQAGWPAGHDIGDPRTGGRAPRGGLPDELTDLRARLREAEQWTEELEVRAGALDRLLRAGLLEAPGIAAGDPLGVPRARAEMAPAMEEQPGNEPDAAAEDPRSAAVATPPAGSVSGGAPTTNTRPESPGPGAGPCDPSQRPEQEIIPLPDERALIAASPAMRGVLDQVRQVMATEATVLIQGESGTGKELIARAIHAGSARRGRPLVALNCAAIPEALLESELFGHERGAFTGATHRKPGRFERAQGGILFLDEIAELPAACQAKLLRALEEREVERLGGARTVKVDVRILAATNQDLFRLVREQRFREDLYYRLEVITIRVPPLRERPDDLVPLARHFLALRAQAAGKALRDFAPEALALLRRHPWPGNVRELEHAVQRAVILARGPEVTAGDLGLSPARDLAVTGGPPHGSGPPAELTRELIVTTLERCRGNRSAAARVLGIDRSTLWRKLRHAEEAP